ncbi:MAG: fatty acid desaturase [Planctomycetes bacterium]|nr:fatty acid desaturase [Planctomycetota bacterium]
MFPTPSRTRPVSFFRFASKNVNKVYFVALHILVATVFLVPVTWTALGLCVGFYIVRMFGITAGYHRYFSHRAYKTSRWFQFVLACIGCSAMQKGPLWWAANHRDHHKHSDKEEDPHSPVRHGVLWSHIGWILSQRSEGTNLETIKDFARFPELRLLEMFYWFPAFILAGICYLVDGWSGVVWGFVVSSVLLYHGTFLVNSACHIFGSRRFETTDASRNNALVAILTLGEGWHNNHHHYQSSANQGFHWWEIDMSYYSLLALRSCGLVWDLRKPPAKKLHPTASVK